jgi:hypothetical protein
VTTTKTVQTAVPSENQGAANNINKSTAVSAKAARVTSVQQGVLAVVAAKKHQVKNK